LTLLGYWDVRQRVAGSVDASLAARNDAAGQTAYAVLRSLLRSRHHPPQLAKLGAQVVELRVASERRLTRSIEKALISRVPDEAPSDATPAPRSRPMPKNLDWLLWLLCKRGRRTQKQVGALAGKLLKTSPVPQSAVSRARARVEDYLKSGGHRPEWLRISDRLATGPNVIPPELLALNSPTRSTRPRAADDDSPPDLIGRRGSS
jgi:hypothetical protein